MAAIVVETAAKKPFNNSLCDCCGSPGGCSTCCYVMCCPCLAAGSVAEAAGRSYCMSCILTFTPVWPCWLACDRAELIDKYSIASSDGFVMNCLMFACGCGSCLLCQELNHIKASPPPGGTTTVVVVPPQQQAMGQAPGAFGGPSAYQG